MVMMAITSQAQTLSGKITNENNEAVVGANIHLLNSNEGTVSDAQGDYQLNNLSPGKYTVVVSAIGFAEENKEINLTQSGAVLNFKLNNS
jgi:iron complex outermembrane receptor protein